ncbi:uncharacterized protein ARMOST_13602 [Armillaria ostoyae]|uniref:Uncharacterized protein n=1 Tax=Armillaria ostoyae TaxID=47428 RepID=A0A284RNA3_ARMOS|nr:uncharacterized protein ARMOST_13602 [Armillaria ostoyae]
MTASKMLWMSNRRPNTQPRRLAPASLPDLLPLAFNDQCLTLLSGLLNSQRNRRKKLSEMRTEQSYRTPLKRPGDHAEEFPADTKEAD